MHMHAKLAIQIMSKCSQLYFVDAANCCIDAPICLVGKQSQHNVMSFACTSHHAQHSMHSTACVAHHASHQRYQTTCSCIKPLEA